MYIVNSFADLGRPEGFIRPRLQRAYVTVLWKLDTGNKFLA
jgi:hypothetical protein